MIIGKGIRLRAVEREDIPRFVRWLNDPEVIRYITINSPFSQAMEEKWFDHQLAIPTTEGQTLAVEVSVGDNWVHIGNTGLHKVEPVNNTAEFGLLLGEKDYWHKGYGRYTTELMLKHGFEDMNLNRIYLNVFSENVFAIKAYEAAGFVTEGVQRQAMYKNGKYNDIILMSVLHSEWKGLES